MKEPTVHVKCYHEIIGETHGTVCFAGLNAAGIVIPDATGGVPFSFPPHVDLLQDLDVPTHTRRELGAEVNQIRGPRAQPEVRGFLVVDLLQRQTRYENLDTSRSIFFPIVLNPPQESLIVLPLDKTTTKRLKRP